MIESFVFLVEINFRIHVEFYLTTERFLSLA